MKRTRSLGISCPDGREIFELYIAVESRPSVLARIATMMGENSIDILAGHMQCSDDRQSGYDLFYLEMADSKVSPEELVQALRKLEFVQDARIESKAEVKFETMMFPLTRSGHTRMFVLPAGGWSALINSILDTFGTAGGVILQNQGVSVGGEIVESIKKLFHVPVGDELEVENLEAYFGAMGLGVLEISQEVRESKRDGMVVKVSIAHPIVASTATTDPAGAVVDQFLVGIVRGAISRIHSHEYLVKNLNFDKDGETIHFELLPSPKDAQD